MALPSGPIHMDRTDELYAKLDESREKGSQIAILELLEFDFVWSPTPRRHKVYGPADVMVVAGSEDHILMNVLLRGKQPEQKQTAVAEPTS